MTPQEFQRLAQKDYNRIPIMRQVLADLDTPLSTYLKLADAPYSYLLESVEGGEKWGRYSMIGLPCRTVLKVFGRQIRVETDGELVEHHEDADPMGFVERFQARYRVPEMPGEPRFNGGLVGYFGYDAVRYVETKLGEADKPDPLGTPDVLLMLSDELVIFDNLSAALYVITHADPSEEQAYERAQQRLDALVAALERPVERPCVEPVGAGADDREFTFEFAQPDHEASVERIKEYILAGDVMQVVLSQRMSRPFGEPPLNLYRALRAMNPSPYMYFFNLGDFHIVGSSPEILARCEQDRVTVRPIAGTRRRGQTEAEDKRMEEDLLADPKERAEHLMLIDLGRNDVGRVAKPGTVELSEEMAVERYSHVMHLVSHVEGQLREGLSAMDVLRASLPAGTLSGAPKFRAMEIIDELEPVKRGVYGGAVGYLSWHGNMDTAIAIRTAVIKDERLYVQAGGGVVADSVPGLEWKETLNKGRALFRAAAMAEAGLSPEDF